nr:MAG TPA: hypothetical protein [Caudoviricetes sp.]DAI83240.1 MAG TPA: hypothetical protein [Caudoviricetes sp.]DAI92306.1 MAG TPA: hypothetical protein [Bacteriophage sp.]
MCYHVVFFNILSYDDGYTACKTAHPLSTVLYYSVLLFPVVRIFVL